MATVEFGLPTDIAEVAHIVVRGHRQEAGLVCIRLRSRGHVELFLFLLHVQHLLDLTDVLHKSILLLQSGVGPLVQLQTAFLGIGG